MSGGSVKISSRGGWADLYVVQQEAKWQVDEMLK